ncbi:MAG: hypothetical protein ACTHU0_33815 [Kofleriaceae bacterium]
MSKLRILVAFACLAVAAGAAAASCPDGVPAAACALHDEGVELFTAGKFEEAAAKFRAAIAAAPSARSYLGYSQAVEGQGQIALAYETMLIAQRMSNDEMAATGGRDTDVVGRAERIKYKLSELGGKVGFVWLRLPPNVAPQRVVSVHREHEGDLPSPLGRWITVAPGRQVLVASLDDGTQLEMVATVAPGAQSSLVIPIPAPAAAVRTPQGPTPALGRPLISLYKRPSAPPAPLPTTTISAGGAVLSPGPGDTHAGVGFTAFYERRLARVVAVIGRADYLFHPSSTKAMTDLDGPMGSRISGSEVLLLTGVRTRSRTLHARLETGATVYTQKLELLGRVSDTDVYPVVSAGGGLQLGRLRFHASVMWTLATGQREMPVRFFGTLALDLWRD